MKKIIFLLFSVLSFTHNHAQSGELDPTFNAGDIGFGNGDGSDGTIFCTALQPDGKILIGGTFTKYNGQARQYLTRINSDGSLDLNFSVTFDYTASPVTVNSVVLQPDEKIIIAGTFLSINGVPAHGVARVNPDGSMDGSFNANLDNNNFRKAILQPDGKIILVGDFVFTGKHITRLNSDGSIDTGFNPGSGAMFGITQYNHVTNVENAYIQSDGKIIIVGNFTAFNGIARSHIARLNMDGSVDSSFAPTSGFGFQTFDDVDVNSISVQADGKILIGGSFNSYDGITANGLVRINPNGTIDTGFVTGTGFVDEVNATEIQEDGKILAGGNFINYNGITVKKLIRLNSDGSYDASFVTNEGFFAEGFSFSNLYGAVYSIALRPDGKMIIGGDFDKYDTVRTGSLVRLNATGTLDITYNTGTGANDNITFTQIQPDGKILIGGSFTKYNGDLKRYLNRLNEDGTVDSSFNIGSGFANTDTTFSNLLIPEILAIAIQPDGKIIVGGLFTSYNGVLRKAIVRLNSDGTVDNTFNTIFTADHFRVSQIAVQPDGKILINNYGELLRLYPNGELDQTFSVPVFNFGGNFCQSFLVQPDGKILFHADYSLWRLNSNCTVDTTFNQLEMNPTSNMTLQPDGKILLWGGSIGVNGVGIGNIARILPNGSLDVSFYPTDFAILRVLKVKLQTDGKIIIGGQADGKALYRLNSNGSLDRSFNPDGTGASAGFPIGITNSDMVNDICFQNDNKIIIAGNFTSYNGVGRNRLARVFTTEPLSVANNNLPQFKIYPNPATTYLNIDLPPEFDIKNIEVYDMLGRLVLTINDPGLSQLNIASLDSGTYILKVFAGNGIISKQFIKQ